MVSLLDADDSWQPVYLQRVYDCFIKNNSIDFIACNVRYFDKHDDVWNESKTDVDNRFTSCLVSLSDNPPWLGSPTSGLSLRRNLFAKILRYPIDFDYDWRIQADDLIVFGASILGGHKYSIADPLVNYRCHSNNNWFGKNRTIGDTFKYLIKKEQMINYSRFQAFGCATPTVNLVHYEFKCIKNPAFLSLFLYLIFLLMARGGIGVKLRIMLMMKKYWLKSLFFKS